MSLDDGLPRDFEPRLRRLESIPGLPARRPSGCAYRVGQALGVLIVALAVVFAFGVAVQLTILAAKALAWSLRWSYGWAS